MSNRRFYWLKLKEDFFEDDTVAWLEEQENGKDYIIFYLKLCLRSLSDDGNLVRYVGEKLIPYDVKALSKLTNTSLDTVAVAMKTFLSIGLITQLDSGEIYMNQINEMIGTETDSARRMRKKRAKNGIEHSGDKEKIASQCDSDVQKSDIEIEREKELEIDKETEKEEETSDINVHRFYQENFGTETPFIAEDLEYWINDLSKDVVILALSKAIEKNAQYSYAKAIMKDWAGKDIKTVEAAEAESLSKAKQRWKPNFNKTETLPGWTDKQEVDEKISPEEEAEFKKQLAEIRAMKSGKG